MGVRLFAATFVLVVHALAAWLLLNPGALGIASATAEPALAQLPARPAQHRPAPSRLERFANASQLPDDGNSGSGAIGRSDMRDDPNWLAAYEAGRRYEERRMMAIQRAMASDLSAEIAALLGGPPHEAWWQLEQMTLKGDRMAGDALAYLAARCPSDDRPRSAGMVRQISRAQQVLAPDDAAYVTGALHHEVTVADTFDAQCRAHGLGWGRLAAMLGLSDPTTSEQWNDWNYRQALLEQYRQMYGGGVADAERTPADQAMDRLARRESTAASDDLALALAAADHDPQILQRLSICFNLGCKQIPALPPEQLRPWQERAARTGSLFAVDALTRADESSGALESAWAWAWYERWLVANSCGWEPQILDYAVASEALQRIGAQLGPAARARAARLGAERITQFGPQALAANGCTG